MDTPCEHVNTSGPSACSVFPTSLLYRSTPACRPGRRPIDRLVVYRAIATIPRFPTCAWCHLLTTRLSCCDSSDVTMQPCCSSVIRSIYITPVTIPQSSRTNISHSSNILFCSPTLTITFVIPLSTHSSICVLHLSSSPVQ